MPLCVQRLDLPRSRGHLCSAPTITSASVIPADPPLATREEDFHRLLALALDNAARLKVEVPARRRRVVCAFPDGNPAINLAAARLRHIAGTRWSTKRYLNGAAHAAQRHVRLAGAGHRPKVRKILDAASNQSV